MGQDQKYTKHYVSWESAYDEKYIKVKVREFSGVIKTKILGDEVPKENEHYTCIACITIDSVIRMGKRLSTDLFRRIQIQNEKHSEQVKNLVVVFLTLIGPKRSVVILLTLNELGMAAS